MKYVHEIVSTFRRRLPRCAVLCTAVILASLASPSIVAACIVMPGDAPIEFDRVLSGRIRVVTTNEDGSEGHRVISGEAEITPLREPLNHSPGPPFRATYSQEVIGGGECVIGFAPKDRRYKRIYLRKNRTGEIRYHIVEAVGPVWGGK